MASARMACQLPVTGRKTGEATETVWLRVVGFGKVAEALEQCQRGERIAVQGMLHWKRLHRPQRERPLGPQAPGQPHHDGQQRGGGWRSPRAHAGIGSGCREGPDGDRRPQPRGGPAGAGRTERGRPGRPRGGVEEEVQSGTVGAAQRPGCACAPSSVPSPSSALSCRARWACRPVLRAVEFLRSLLPWPPAQQGAERRGAGLPPPCPP